MLLTFKLPKVKTRSGPVYIANKFNITIKSDGSIKPIITKVISRPTFPLIFRIRKTVGNPHRYK